MKMCKFNLCSKGKQYNETMSLHTTQMYDTETHMISDTY
jgi:hypothetical protein